MKKWTGGRIRIAGMLIAFLAACTSGESGGNRGTGENGIPHTCPMHPQVVQQGPGTCPICHMDLVPLAQEGSGQEIVLSPRQMMLGNIEVGMAQYGETGEGIYLAGTLKANEELAKVISSRAGGRIEKLYVKESGQYISKGQPLYELYSEQLLTLQKEYLLTLEQYRELGNTNSRYASFAEAAEKKLLLYGMTQKQVDVLAEAGVVSPNVRFHAPVSGVAAEILAAEGQYVSEGSTLYRIEGLERLWVEAALYPGEADIPLTGSIVQVLVNGFENEPMPGKVIFLSPEYQQNSRIITLRAEIENPGQRFSPGMQANVILEKGSGQALALPSNAIIRGEKGAHVWIKTGEGTFSPRMVKTGVETFRRTVITEGLQAGDSVVFSGAYLLYGELMLKKGTDPMMAGETE